PKKDSNSKTPTTSSPNHVAAEPSSKDTNQPDGSEPIPGKEKRHGIQTLSRPIGLAQAAEPVSHRLSVKMKKGFKKADNETTHVTVPPSENAVSPEPSARRKGVTPAVPVDQSTPHITAPPIANAESDLNLTTTTSSDPSVGKKANRKKLRTPLHPNDPVNPPTEKIDENDTTVTIKPMSAPALSSSKIDDDEERVEVYTITAPPIANAVSDSNLTTTASSDPSVGKKANRKKLRTLLHPNDPVNPSTEKIDQNDTTVTIKPMSAPSLSSSKIDDDEERVEVYASVSRLDRRRKLRNVVSARSCLVNDGSKLINAEPFKNVIKIEEESGGRLGKHARIDKSNSLDFESEPEWTRSKVMAGSGRLEQDEELRRSNRRGIQRSEKNESRSTIELPVISLPVKNPSPPASKPVPPTKLPYISPTIHGVTFGSNPSTQDDTDDVINEAPTPSFDVFSDSDQDYSHHRKLQPKNPQNIKGSEEEEDPLPTKLPSLGGTPKRSSIPGPIVAHLTDDESNDEDDLPPRYNVSSLLANMDDEDDCDAQTPDAPGVGCNRDVEEEDDGNWTDTSMNSAGSHTPVVVVVKPDRRLQKKKKKVGKGGGGVSSFPPTRPASQGVGKEGETVDCRMTAVYGPTVAEVKPVSENIKKDVKTTIPQTVVANNPAAVNEVERMNDQVKSVHEPSPVLEKKPKKGSQLSQPIPLFPTPDLQTKIPSSSNHQNQSHSTPQIETISSSPQPPKHRPSTGLLSYPIPEHPHQETTKPLVLDDSESEATWEKVQNHRIDERIVRRATRQQAVKEKPQGKSGAAPRLGPDSQSNRKIIKNALIHVCLAGTVNEKVKADVLEDLTTSPSTHFIILFRGSKNHAFRGLYSYSPTRSNLTRVYTPRPSTSSNHVSKDSYGEDLNVHNGGGGGPEEVCREEVLEFYKSGGRGLVKVLHCFSTSGFEHTLRYHKKGRKGMGSGCSTVKPVDYCEHPQSDRLPDRAIKDPTTAEPESTHHPYDQPLKPPRVDPTASPHPSATDLKRSVDRDKPSHPHLPITSPATLSIPVKEREKSTAASVGSQDSHQTMASPKNPGSPGSGSGPVMPAAAPEKVTFDGSIRKFLENHVLFQNLEEAFMIQLSNAMQSRIYNPSEFVIRKGEVGRAMFFILRGEVEVVSEDGETILNVMKEQSFFGEIGVLFSVPRTASCRARGRCIILTLTKDKLEKLMEGHPKVAEAIGMIAEERFALHMKQQDSAVKVEFGKELKLGITNRDLKSVPLFRDCEIGFLHMLALSLRPVQYRYGEVIIQKGDLAGEMYFVVDGEAEVFSDEDGKVFANFYPGTFFGEVGLFFKIKRTASVRCTSSTITVFKLAKSDLDIVLDAYPEIDAKIKVEAKQRYEYNKMREMAKLTGKQEVETDIEVVREKLKNIPLFKGGSIGFYHELALALKFKVFQPGDLIIQKDQPGRSMYFVVDGTAEVVSQDGKEVYGTMLPNTFFGEVALFFDINRTASVRSRTVCTLFELEKDALKNILAQHKTLREQMHEKAEENFRLWQARHNAILQLTSSKDIQQFEVEGIVSRLRVVPLFSGCPDNFLRSLATQTSVHSYAHEEIIVKTGDASTDMFFIVSGKVEIISEDGKQVYDTMNEGGFFGEVGLILGVARTASVRCATETSLVIVLSARALERVMEEYPESYQMISLEADKRYQLAQTRRLAEQHASIVIQNRDKMLSGCESTSTGIAAAATAAALAPRTDNEKFRSLSRNNNGNSVNQAKAETSVPVKSSPIGKGRKWPGALPEKSESTLKLSIGGLFKRRASKCEARDVPASSNDDEAALETVSSTSSRDSVTADLALARRQNSVSSDKSGGKLGKILKSFKNTFSRAEKSTRIAPQKDKPSNSKSGNSVGGVTSSKPAPSRQSSCIVKHDHIFDLLEGDLASSFSYINPQERFRLRLVCKRWANLLAEPRLWSNIDFKPIFTRLDPELFLNFVNLSGDFLYSLNLDSCWQVLDDELGALSSYCPNITKLSLRNCWKITDRGLAFLTSTLTKMKEIDLSYCGQINGTGFVDHKWSGLSKINLTYCKQIGDAQLEKIICKTSNVTDLRLRRCSRITDFGVFLVVRYCRYLRVFDLSDCEQISDKCLKWIASSCSDLTDLNLRFCTRITNGGLYDLSLGCQSFRSLDLSFCSNLTDAAIVFFSDSIRSLRFLRMRKCKKITDGVATYLIRATPLLDVLDLSGCPLVSPQAKMALQMCMKKAEIMIDASMASKNANHAPKTKAVEVPLQYVFLSGPAELIRIPLENAASGNHSGRHSPTPVSAKAGRRKSEGRGSTPRKSSQKRESVKTHTGD
ncbi:hypothetical protein HDU67_005243, partial [Dinochytrium kinnereticum]